MAISPILLSKEYLHFVLKAAFKVFQSQTVGIAIPGIGRSDINNHIIPLPPLSEQKRIVAKVDELMALCDELETQQQQRQTVHAQLTTANLHQLTTAETPRQLSKAWQRIDTQFEQLFTTKESIKKLRQTILQLAVQGKLVPQDPNDEPVDFENLSTIVPSDIPYQIPSSWRWTFFDDVCEGITSGWSPKCEGRPKENNEWGVLKVSAVSWDKFNPDENKALPIGKSPKPEIEIQSGDFLMSRANTAALVAKSVVVNDTYPKLMMCDKILRVEFKEMIDKKYANLLNHSLLARDYYARVASGTSESMRNVSRTQIKNLPVPLPPLAEQKRIVAKVNQLMTLCDQLEQSLEAQDTNADNLSNSMTTAVLNAG